MAKHAERAASAMREMPKGGSFQRVGRADVRGGPLAPHLSEVGSPRPILQGFQRACAKVLVLVC
jgi:hypothetical protein